MCVPSWDCRKPLEQNALLSTDTFQLIAGTALSISIFLIIYTYVLYPIILLVWSSLVDYLNDTRGKLPLEPTADSELPNVSVVISAYNEEKHIANRIENLLSMDYPKDKLQILIGSDGSSDNTAEEIKRYTSSPQVVAFLFEENRGKASVLNELVAKATGDILVFSDANTDFAPDNLRKLVAPFKPSIGGVCGELRLVSIKGSATDGGNKDGVYWEYERGLKYFESHLSCVSGANGANYAIRRELYEDIPTSTIVDDLLISTRVCMAGWDFAYAHQAIAEEEQAPDAAEEYKRRVRIGSGNFQFLFENWKDLHRSSATFIFVFWSHKVIRWIVPHCMLIIFLCSGLLAFNSVFFALFFALQAIVYLLSVLNSALVLRVNLHWTLQFIHFFVAMNVGIGHGFVKYLKGTHRPTWERTAR